MYVVRQMIASTHCIVLKMTYDMRDLTFFLIYKGNIIPFFFVGWLTGLEISLNSHCSVINYLFVLHLRGERSNKLWWCWQFWEMNEQSTIILKRFETGYQITDFQKWLLVFHLRIYLTGAWKKTRKWLAHKWLDEVGWPVGFWMGQWDDCLMVVVQF